MNTTSTEKTKACSKPNIRAINACIETCMMARRARRLRPPTCAPTTFSDGNVSGLAFQAAVSGGDFHNFRRCTCPRTSKIVEVVE
jgi:hypothetical protein